MGLINPPDLVNGTTADAVEVNNIKAEIVGVINGGIDNANIKPGSMTAATLASDSVTSAKIVNGSVTASKIDFSTFGNIVMPNAGTTAVNITVTKRSLLYSFATSRTAIVLLAGYRIAISGAGVIKHVTSITNQDQTLRHLSATAYSLVEPGTYTVNRTYDSGSTDNDSIVVMAIPTELGV